MKTQEEGVKEKNSIKLENTTICYKCQIKVSYVHCCK